MDSHNSIMNTWYSCWLWDIQNLNCKQYLDLQCFLKALNSDFVYTGGLSLVNIVSPVVILGV